MSLKDIVHTGKVRMPYRVVIYGAPGVGKSSWAADSPNPIFLDIEGGVHQLDVHSISLKNKTYRSIDASIRMLIEEDHDYETLVIDSIDWLERKIWEKVILEGNGDVQSVEDIPYGKGYASSLMHLNKALICLDALHAKKKMNIILIAHGVETKIEDPMLKPYDKWSLKLHKRTRALIQEWSDAIMFAAKDFVSIKSSESFGKTKYKRIGGDERLLFTKEGPGFDAKTRYSIPECLPLEYSAFEEALCNYYGEE